MGEKTTTHRMGPLKVGIHGNNNFADLVRDEAGEKIDRNSSSDVLFHFESGSFDRGFKPDYYCGGNFSFNSTDICVDEGGYRYHTDGLFSEGKTEVFVEFNPSKSATDRAVNFLRWFLSPSNTVGLERTKTRFCSYTTFWPLIHLELLSSDSAFIHASVVDDGETGIVVSGTGGSGKTSTTFELLKDTGCRYLSEDFGIVSNTGKSFRSPRFATIYHSDYQYGQPHLVRYVDNKLTGIDKMHWNMQVRRGANPRRKTPPEMILGKEKTANTTELGYGFYVLRENTDSVKLRKIGTEEFVERSLWASFRELKRFYDLLCQTRAVGADSVEIPSINRLIDRTREIYIGCFDGVETYLLNVPEDGTPADVVEKICAVK